MAYVLWGLLPVFWKLLDDVPALEILSHRIVWSLALCVFLLVLSKRVGWIGDIRKHPRALFAVAGATILLSFNWGLYIWAVNSGHIVETSLGYFINPLINVALGVLVLKEQLRRPQWIAIATAAIGVLFLSVVYGHPPWISLALGVSFAFYGLLKKQAKLPALEGLTLETALVALPALAFLFSLSLTGESQSSGGGFRQTALLVGAGAATATPLLFFSAAAQRIPLSLLGVLQYIAPSIQFLLGVFAYGEDFDSERLIGFAIIWLALALFAGDAVLFYRRRAVDVSAR
jgi:chloramphenicol-sensitive protein RarD